MNPKNLSEQIKLAINEDIGDGDHSSISCIPEKTIGQAHLLVKEQGILAGINVAMMVFHQIDPALELEVFLADGAKIKNGDVAFVVSGKVLSILQSERLVLNFMQRMSGIATTTNKYVKKLEGLKTKVLDTRKTTPGLRVFEKMAVKTGGGENHRMGLFDMIMLKDNHIEFAGGIKKAINSTHTYLESIGKNLKIEIEARNLNELREILETGRINRIMLDNLSSGGITLETILDYAECGVDYISVGALTHQIHSLDMSLKALN